MIIATVNGRRVEMQCDAKTALMLGAFPSDGCPPGTYIAVKTTEGRSYIWRLDPKAQNR
jgi:hypothetical protein